MLISRALLETTGFEIAELDMVFAAADNAASPEDDKIPDLQPTRTITKPHDFWTMGDHRLICADARRPESFVQLLSGHKADLVFVDPPYNVRIRGHVSGRGLQAP